MEPIERIIQRIISAQGSRLGDRFRFDEAPKDIDLGPVGVPVGWYINVEPENGALVFCQEGLVAAGVVNSRPTKARIIIYSDIERVHVIGDKRSAQELLIETRECSVSLAVSGCDPVNSKYRDVFVVATLLSLIVRACKADRS